MEIKRIYKSSLSNTLAELAHLDLVQKRVPPASPFIVSIILPLGYLKGVGFASITCQQKRSILFYYFFYIPIFQTRSGAVNHDL